MPGRDQKFSEKANNLAHFSDRANQTAQIVAVGGSAANKRLAEDLLVNASQVEKLSPQLISAGRIRLTYPSSKVLLSSITPSILSMTISITHSICIGC